MTSVLTSDGTPGDDGATLTFEPTEAMTGDTVYVYAENADGAIVGAGGANTVVTQSPSIDITEAVIVTSDEVSLFVDTLIPTNTITGVAYDSDFGTITITGTNFTSVADADEDVTELLDWTKFVWDIDGDDASTSGHTFTAADFASVVVQDTNTIVATLTSDAKDGTPESLELAQGFAADGIGAINLDDDIDVTAGFGVDACRKSFCDGWGRRYFSNLF